MATEASLDVVKAIVNCNTMLDKHEPTIYLVLIVFSKFVLSRAREGSTTSNLLTNSAYINQVLTGNYCWVNFLITIREYSETET